MIKIRIYTRLTHNKGILVFGNQARFRATRHADCGVRVAARAAEEQRVQQPGDAAVSAVRSQHVHAPFVQQPAQQACEQVLATEVAERKLKLR